MKLSIIIPAHNEERRIAKTLEDYGDYFSKRYKKDFEMVVVLNACKDDTLGVVKGYSKMYPWIRILNFKQGGKGFAVMEGFKAAKGNLIGFTDADDSTSAPEFNKMIESIDGFDGIIGSRWMKESVVEPKQPLTRRIASRGFNLLVRALLGIRLQDTQCGAKLFKREAIKKVLPKLGVTEWAFDIDLLYQMKLEGIQVIEIPITWRDSEGSRLKVGKTSFKMFLAILRLKLINSGLGGIVSGYDSLPEWIKLHHNLK